MHVPGKTEQVPPTSMLDTFTSFIIDQVSYLLTLVHYSGFVIYKMGHDITLKVHGVHPVNSHVLASSWSLVLYPVQVDYISILCHVTVQTAL